MMVVSCHAEDSDFALKIRRSWYTSAFIFVLLGECTGEEPDQRQENQRGSHAWVSRGDGGLSSLISVGTKRRERFSGQSWLTLWNAWILWWGGEKSWGWPPSSDLVHKCIHWRSDLNVTWDLHTFVGSEASIWREVMRPPGGETSNRNDLLWPSRTCPA